MMGDFFFGEGCESEIHDVTNCYKNSIVHAVLGYTYRDLVWLFCTVHVPTLQMQHSTCRI